MNENNGFIKIHRKILTWEWYDDVNTCRMFIHCLLKSNWKSGSWHGIKYNAGEFITSLQTLAKETHLTVSQVRVALNHLKMTGEIADRRHGNARIITVIKWNDYQLDDRPNDKPVTDQSQTNDKPVTTDEEYKKERKEENNISREPEHNLFGVYHNVRLTDGEMQELINQYPSDYQNMIENLSTYMKSKGKIYEDHFATLMRWKHEDEEKAKQKTDTKSKRRNLIEEIRNA